MEIFDVVVIGGGCAGYTAGIYAGRANLKVVILEGENSGGQLAKTSDVENFPGFEDAINGGELMNRMRAQAVKWAKNILENSAVRIEKANVFEIFLDNGEKLRSRAVIIATGASVRRLDVPGEKEFWLNGISGCAVCDGPLPVFYNKVLAVIGGGDSAMEEALYLTKFARELVIIHRSSNFRASKIMLERAKLNPKIRFLTDTHVKEIIGTDMIEKLRLVSGGVESELEVGGMFYGIGHIPNTAFLRVEGSVGASVKVDSEGYIVVNGSETSVPGIFSAGDVHDKKYRQAVTAAASGCMAAIDTERYLETL
ncbi:MAG: NADPH-dependent thioredoxin reductase [Harvfovirus sp.]|uniref:NADPH-dependent thioredoxin reductase n=1 Tax=Harvfovirus sp. TaxID=2487768 RepID=A0A3G5A4V5_9VIRU|nr:MAG: NADPH-dependent thioredoxin reductase [Harvfovirus sp.]